MAFHLSLLLFVTGIALAQARLFSEKELITFKEEEELLKRCYVRSSITSPIIHSAEPIAVNVSLSVSRLTMVDDVDESFSLFGNLRQTWKVDCISQLYHDPTHDWPEQVTFLDHLHVSNFWWPDFCHTNTLTNEGLVAMDRRLWVSIPEGVFTGLTIGIFKSRCDLDFTKFPFDS